ncbi:NUDIX domain-containing protein [Phenylobacterium sp.]|uniref:NUDIX domain-containing protein n=1 Tax=Phenylobacterium sp. TaxID=1871053 RepID=UPI003784F3A9
MRAIAQNEDGRILLVEHTYRGGWWLPGGGVEPRESVFGAVERELREEAGVTLAEPPRLLSLHTHREALADDHIAVFFAHIGSVRPVASREIRRVELFAVESLPWAQIDRGCARRLREFLEGEAPTPQW